MKGHHEQSQEPAPEVKEVNLTLYANKISVGEELASSEVVVVKRNRVNWMEFVNGSGFCQDSSRKTSLKRACTDAVG